MHTGSTGPNLFIVGAPKCGTTSLYEYLRVHPQIYFPAAPAAEDPDYWRLKEPAYFCPDLGLPPEVSIQDEAEYLRLYAPAGGYAWRGDATSNYLYSKVAATRIHDFCPDARILISLRPPLAQMRSLHNNLLHSSREDIPDFYAAVALSDRRRQGFDLPKRGIAGWLDYLGYAHYADQVERFLRAFGHERVHVLLLEDLNAHPRETYRAILKFLGVDDRFQPAFRTYHSRAPAGAWERTVYAAYALPGVHRLTNAIFPVSARQRVSNRMRQAHDRRLTVARREDPRELALRALLRPDIQRLSKLIDRDLTHWL